MKHNVIDTPEKAEQHRRDTRIHDFLTITGTLAGSFAFDSADQLLADLADPELRRTLRRRAHGFGHVIDQERAVVGFTKLQPVFALLASTMVEDSVDTDLRLTDLAALRAQQPKRRG